MTGIGLMLLLDGLLLGWLLLPVALVTQLSFRMLEFDLQQQTYREGIFWLGLKVGKKLPLPGIACIFLKENSYTRLVESRASMSNLKYKNYDAYLQLEDGVKLHVLQYTQREPALQRAQAMATELGIGLRDLTQVQL